MKERCFSPKCKDYKDYGGRGITICERWLDFENFYVDMGDKPKGLSIGRIDNNDNYCPENCRWETSVQQARNKTSNVIIEYNGYKKPLIEWCEILGLSYKTIYRRLTRGWSIEKAFTYEIQKDRKLYVVYKGIEKSMVDWCKEFNIPLQTAIVRRNRGWSIERTFEEPLRIWPNQYRFQPKLSS